MSCRKKERPVKEQPISKRMAQAAKYREDIRKGVESLINCLICTDEYKNPKVLPCQHTFCLECIQKHYECHNQQRIIRTSNFPCPQCRKTVYMPNNGLDGLPNDFKVGQIQDVFDKIHITIEGKGINCDVCRYEYKRSKSESFCNQCSKYLCDRCTQNHATNTLFSSHTTFSIGTQNVENLVCGEHKEEIKYYCTQCKIALCTVCALSKHSKHETQDVAEALDQQRKTIVEYNDLLKTNLLAYEAKAEQLATLKKEREKNVVEMKDLVRKHVQIFVRKIKEDELRLTAELEKTLKTSAKDIDKEIEMIHSTVKGIKSMCDTAEAYLLNGQTLDLMNKFDRMMIKMKKCAEPPSPRLPSNITRAIKFAPNNEPRIGELGFEFHREEDVSASGSQDSHKKSSSKAKAKITNERLANCNGADISIPPAKANIPLTRSQSLREEAAAMSKATTIRSSPKRSSTPVRMSPLRSSTPVNSGSSPETVSNSNEPTSPSTVESDGARGGASEYVKQANPNEPKIKWKTFEKSDARDLAFLSDGTIVVTEYKEGSDKLQLFDSCGNLKKCVACSSQNMLRPWGCTVNHQSGQIVVTDHGDRSVKVLDQDLSIRQVWRALFDKPSGVAVMRTGDYIITDTGAKSHMCSIHSTSGIRKREFATKGTSNCQLLAPNFVMADHNDRIVIADSEQHCIKIFDTRGKQLLKFGSHNDEQMIPMGLCVDAQNNILIADHAYHGISLYSSDGKFIQHIAQLKELPYGVALHDNGQMAVATDPSLYMFSIPMFKT